MFCRFLRIAAITSLAIIATETPAAADPTVIRQSLGQPTTGPKKAKPVNTALKTGSGVLPLRSRPVEATPANPVRLINVEAATTSTPSATILTAKVQAQPATPTQSISPLAIAPLNTAVPPANASALTCIAGCN
jgi:hypothetical protein